MLSEEMKIRLDEQLKEKCEAVKLPGMALVISQHGEPVYENYYGYRDVEKQLPVTVDTVFGLASITKSLVCLAIMQLKDAGKLSVDDKVTDWLPALKLPNADYTKQLKVRHLMTHTSGLPGMFLVHNARSKSILADPDGEYLFGEIPKDDKEPIVTVDDLIERIGETDFTLLGAPGEVFNYSNEGFALLQPIIELASGTSFSTYIEETIFQPLGMKDSYFLNDSIADKENVIELYAYKKDGKETFHSPAWWDVGDIYSNGSLKCSSADLMKYIEVYRLNGLVGDERIVSEESIKEMTSPIVTLPNGGSYGYGIEVDQFQHIHHFGHSGGIKGVSSNFQVIKEKDLTASILINMADVAAGDILLSSMKTLLDVPAEEKVEESISLSAEALQQFAGKYKSAEGNKATVTVSGNGLELSIDEETKEIYPISENGFSSSDGVRYHFMRDGEEVTGIMIGKRVIGKVE